MAYVGEGVLYMISYEQFDIYETIRVVLIMDCVGFTANLFNFAIMAYVIFRTSKMLRKSQKSHINSIFKG